MNRQRANHHSNTNTYSRLPPMPPTPTFPPSGSPSNTHLIHSPDLDFSSSSSYKAHLQHAIDPSLLLNSDQFLKFKQSLPFTNLTSAFLSKPQIDYVHFAFCKHSAIGKDFVDFHLNILDMDHLEIYGLILAMAWKLDLPNILHISFDQLLDWSVAVDSKYFNNPYHSFNHAVDVTFICFYSLTTLRANELLTDLEQIAIFFAALCHDLGHPGRNNTYMINIQHALASKYRNQSVLESYSADIGRDLLAKFDILTSLSPPTRDLFLDLFTDLILATDMSKHFALVKELGDLSAHLLNSDQFNALATNIRHQLNINRIHSFQAKCPAVDSEHLMLTQSVAEALHRYSAAISNDAPSSLLPHAQSVIYSLDHRESDPAFKDVFSSASDISLSLNTSLSYKTCPSSCDSSIPHLSATAPGIDLSGPASKSPADAVQGVHWLSAERRRQLVKSLLHAADISNTVRPWELCKRWSDLVENEHFAQGDDEQALGLPLSSPNMDRRNCQQAKVSIDFSDVIIHPFFVLLADVIPGTDLYLDQLGINRILWEQIHERDRSHRHSTWRQADVPHVLPLSLSPKSSSHTHEFHSEASSSTTKSTDPPANGYERGRRLSVAAGTIVVPEHFFRAAGSSPLASNSPTTLDCDSPPPDFSTSPPVSTAAHSTDIAESTASAMDITPQRTPPPIKPNVPFIHLHMHASVSMPASPTQSVQNVENDDFDKLYLAYLARAQSQRQSKRSSVQLDASPILPQLNLNSPPLPKDFSHTPRPLSPFVPRGAGKFRRYSLEPSRRRRRSSAISRQGGPELAKSSSSLPGGFPPAPGKLCSSPSKMNVCYAPGDGPEDEGRPSALATLQLFPNNYGSLSDSFTFVHNDGDLKSDVQALPPVPDYLMLEQQPDAIRSYSTPTLPSTLGAVPRLPTMAPVVTDSPQCMGTGLPGSSSESQSGVLRKRSVPSKTADP